MNPYPPPGAPPPGAPYGQMPGYPSAPMQGYPPAGPSVPLPTMLLNVGFALEVLGLVLRAMNGFMVSEKRLTGIAAITTLSTMCIGVGLVLIAFSLTTQSLKDKEIGTAVRVTALIAAVLLLFTGSGSGFLGR